MGRQESLCWADEAIGVLNNGETLFAVGTAGILDLRSLRNQVGSIWPHKNDPERELTGFWFLTASMGIKEERPVED